MWQTKTDLILKRTESRSVSRVQPAILSADTLSKELLNIGEMEDTFSFKFNISLLIFCRFMTQNGRDSGGYQKFLFNTDSSDVPKNQFQKLKEDET